MKYAKGRVASYVLHQNVFFVKADYRLRNGDLSQEQHRDLMEKLGQFYELQKWQRRHSTDMPIPPHSFHDRPPFMLPQPASHPSGIHGGMPLPDSNTRAHESRRNNDRLQGNQISLRVFELKCKNNHT